MRNEASGTLRLLRMQPLQRILGHCGPSTKLRLYAPWIRPAILSVARISASQGVEFRTVVGAVLRGGEVR
jgi:hypothetical protein